MTKGLELEEAQLLYAAERVGEGPVVMLNLLRFRPAPVYPDDFEGARATVSRQGYHENYVGGFRAACVEAGVAPEVVYAGRLVAGDLINGIEDDWDEIALVRYPSFGDFRSIIATETYAREARPHRLAVLANWRFSLTQALAR